MALLTDDDLDGGGDGGLGAVELRVAVYGVTVLRRHHDDVDDGQSATSGWSALVRDAGRGLFDGLIVSDLPASGRDRATATASKDAPERLGVRIRASGCLYAAS